MLALCLFQEDVADTTDDKSCRVGVQYREMTAEDEAAAAQELSLTLGTSRHLDFAETIIFAVRL